MSRREGPDLRQPERWQARMAERTAPRLTARRGWMISRYSSTKPARIMDDARLAPASQGIAILRPEPRHLLDGALPDQPAVRADLGERGGQHDFWFRVPDSGEVDLEVGSFRVLLSGGPRAAKSW